MTNDEGGNAFCESVKNVNFSGGRRTLMGSGQRVRVFEAIHTSFETCDSLFCRQTVKHSALLLLWPVLRERPHFLPGCATEI